MINEEQLRKDLAETHAKDPLHGKSLKFIVEFLYEKYGWHELGNLINIKCLQLNPSVLSSLTFLRKTEWARVEVQDLYVHTINSESGDSKSQKLINYPGNYPRKN